MDINKVIEDGITLAREGHYADALKIFEDDLCFTQNPTAMAYYALCLANIEGNYDKAISLCLMAAEKEFYNPEIYLSLGRIFLLNGQKAVAVKSFRKGLTFDSSHNILLQEVKKLGMRRKPVITFLPRQNMVNRLFGLLSYRFAA